MPLYQYGSDPAHTVWLSEKEAWAVNNLRITDVVGTYAKVNLTPEQMKDYDRAAEFLNEYIRLAGGSIPCAEGYLDNHDVLTLVK